MVEVTAREENGEFCVTAGPVRDQDCWHTDLLVKALTVN